MENNEDKSKELNSSSVDNIEKVSSQDTKVSSLDTDVSQDKNPPEDECKPSLSVSIKWSGGVYPISIYDGMTVIEFKEAVYSETKVRPDKQKIVNLKCKGKPATDEMQMSSLGLRNNMKLMMVGSVDEVLAEAVAVPEDMPEVINDLDISEENITCVQNRQDYIEKIEKRVREYKPKLLNPMRPGKKLLVLDIDYTLFDHRSVGQNGLELMRPYLHHFLVSAYEDYDLAIWSATSMKWIEEKMRLLGVTSNPNYNICFYVDSLAMIRIDAPNYGVVEVKPLGVIWGKYSHYTSKNTIMFDDLRRNFLMNPQNGLKIKAFRNAHENRDTDVELLKLAVYLKDIAVLQDLSKLRHSKWENYRKGGY
uniref:Ubiquitin-like domain-containing CTD phosphatase 1 n=2 Tax=Hirondellea gigas TaxID=1518452 RepID=A0A2P2HZU0_9CRUS